MAMTYEITGIPGVAVRVGRALERWGARAARPVTDEELHLRRARQLAADEAIESRRAAYADMYPYLR